MSKLAYETHSSLDPRLPFIFGRGHVSAARRQGVNNWHENIELIRITSGTGYIRRSSKDIPVEQGDIFVANSNIPHRVCTEHSLRCTYLIIDNSFFLSNGLDPEKLYFQEVIRDLDLNELFDRVQLAYAAYNQQDPCTVAELRYAVLGVLCRLCRFYITDPPSDDRSTVSPPVKRALAYIRGHLESPLSLDSVARQVNVSRSYLAREFKRCTGQTVVQSINLIRCTRAQQMIENGASVSRAAFACGYENLSYFTRTFKKLMGHLPSHSK